MLFGCKSGCGFRRIWGFGFIFVFVVLGVFIGIGNDEINGECVAIRGKVGGVAPEELCSSGAACARGWNCWI